MTLSLKYQEEDEKNKKYSSLTLSKPLTTKQKDLQLDIYHRMVMSPTMTIKIAQRYLAKVSNLSRTKTNELTSRFVARGELSKFTPPRLRIDLSDYCEYSVPVTSPTFTLLSKIKKTIKATGAHSKVVFTHLYLGIYKYINNIIMSGLHEWIEVQITQKGKESGMPYRVDNDFPPPRCSGEENISKNEIEAMRIAMYRHLLGETSDA